MTLQPHFIAGRISGTITLTIRPIIAALAGMALIAAPLSVLFRNQLFAMVEQHFAEPASTFPTLAVAAGFVGVAIILGLIWLYLEALANVTKAAKGDTGPAPITADSLFKLGWIMLAIHLCHYPVAWLGQIVETAFKGPTSTVEVSHTAISLLSVLTLFTLAGISSRGKASTPASNLADNTAANTRREGAM